MKRVNKIRKVILFMIILSITNNSFILFYNKKEKKITSLLEDDDSVTLYKSNVNLIMNFTGVELQLFIYFISMNLLNINYPDESFVKINFEWLLVKMNIIGIPEIWRVVMEL